MSTLQSPAQLKVPMARSQASKWPESRAPPVQSTSVSIETTKLTLRLVFHCSDSKARPLLFFTWENALASTVRQGRLCIHPSKTCMRVTKISAQEKNMRSSWYRSVKGNCAGILRWPIFSELRMAADPNTPKTRCSRKK